jgi:glycosyltransferase involved in cell wall biosynthesis
MKNLAAKKMAVETIQVYEKLIAETADKQTGNNDLSLTDRPLVSILLPCYNAEKYLQECLDSIFQQTYTNFELIIVNDASTDNTTEIIRKNNDRRIVYLENPANEGIVSSLNKAIEKAQGKYIARIDADDLMQKVRLLKQVQFLENQENINVAMVGSGHFVINNMGKPLGIKTYPLTNEEIKTCLLFRNPFSHPSMMIREAVMRKYMYSKKYKHNEDYELWFKIAADHKVANIPEFCTYYRIHQNNISIENSKEQRENTLELLSDQLDNLGIEHSAQDLVIHSAINFGYGVHYFNSREKNQLLKTWLNKILKQLKLKHNFSNTFINKMDNYIVETYCK